ELKISSDVKPTMTQTKNNYSVKSWRHNRMRELAAVHQCIDQNTQQEVDKISAGEEDDGSVVANQIKETEKVKQNN
ncbi:hypothetical protein E2562_028840, partial [Oryza meyeriana var. granulata]